MVGAVPVELKDSKLYKKVNDLVDKAKADEILAMDSDKLKEYIGQLTIAADNAKNEVEANGDYLRAQDVIATLKGGLRSTVNPWKACIKLSLAVLQSRGDHKG